MHCPTCAADIGDAPICQRCGSLPGIERRVQKTRSEFQNFIDQKLALLPAHFEARHFLWACAVVPLFLVPPLFSLIYSIRAMQARQTQNASADFEWISIISALNLVVSLLLLYKLHLFVDDLWIQSQENFGSFVRNLFQLFFRPTPNPDSV
jgi:hypothetical protein